MWIRWKRWQPALLLIAAMLAIGLTNCVTDSETSTVRVSPAVGGSSPVTTAFVFGLVGEPVNLKSGNVTDANSVYVQQQIYDRLLDTKPGTTEIDFGLATEYASPDNGKTWRFKLREGIKFHDGTDFNAEAVRLNVDRWWNPPALDLRDGKADKIWSTLLGGFKGTPESMMQAVKVIDPTTIEFQLKEPFAAFPAAIASGYFGIASPDAIQKAGVSYGSAGSTAVGTGPYVLKEWRTGDRIVLDKNPNYWNEGTPLQDQVVFRFIPDPAIRLAELRSGSIDFTTDLAPDQLPKIEGDANLKAVKRPSFNVGYFALNPSYEPLSKLEVRQAIAMAINRPKIVEEFWGDLGQTAASFLPPSLQQYTDKSLQPYEYNPDRAQQMLATAGYPNGFDLDLWYMPVSSPYFPTPKLIAEAMAADLQAIGINANLKTKDWAAYLSDRNQAPGFQSFMLGWTGNYGDPDNFYYTHFGPGATQDLGNWKDEKVIQLLEDGRRKSDAAQRQQIYQQVDKLLHEQAVRIPIVHSQSLLAQRNNINGWEPSPLGSESFKRVEKQ